MKHCHIPDSFSNLINVHNINASGKQWAKWSVAKTTNGSINSNSRKLTKGSEWGRGLKLIPVNDKIRKSGNEADKLSQDTPTNKWMRCLDVIKFCYSKN